MILKIVFIYFILLPIALAVNQLEVQGLFYGKAVLLVDGQRYVIKAGESSPEGIKVISADSRSAVLEVDGDQKEYFPGSAISMDFKKSAVIKEQIMANDHGMFLTYGSINGRTVQFLVDTGATLVAMSSVEAKRLGIPFRLDGQLTSASTASGVVKAWGVKLKSIKVGNIKQKNIQAMVLEGAHPTEVLLGMSFMERLKVNKEGDKLVFEQKQ